MHDYDVKYIYNYFYIHLTVTADNSDGAITAAEAVMQDEGITAPIPSKIYVELLEEYNV